MRLITLFIHAAAAAAWAPTSRALLSGTPNSPDELSYAFTDVSPTTGPTNGTIVLVHGYPETSYQFRKVLPLLVEQGYRVIAPDIRGAGYSSKPRDGYDEVTIAGDIARLLSSEHLAVEGKVHIVGLDIGCLVAHAFATRFEALTGSVVWGECLIPGTEIYEEVSPSVWHFQLHCQLDLPESLTSGREAQYIKHFYFEPLSNPTAYTSEDLDFYTVMFTQTGAMRAYFELYRNIPRDAQENQEWWRQHGKSRVPALILNGEFRFSTGYAVRQGNQTYVDFEVASVEGSGHWGAAENPEDFVRKVVGFLGRHRGGS